MSYRREAPDVLFIGYTHKTRYEMKRAVLAGTFGVLAAILVASCGGTVGTGGDPDSGTDTGTDSTADMVTDTVVDTGDDVIEDVIPDTATDVVTDVPEDNPVDTDLDTGVDTVIDTVVDTVVDTGPDGSITGGPDCSDPGTAVLGVNSGDSSDDSDSYAIDGCNNLGGPDEVWEFTSTDEGIYTFTMETDGFMAVMMVWETCGSDSEYACLNPDPDSTTASGSFLMGAGETIYLLADDDTEGGAGGAYTITIDYAPIPPGDDCTDIATATDGTNDGNTSIFGDDYEGECEGGSTPPISGPDQMWEYTATCTGTLNVEMDTYSGGNPFLCTLDLQTTCGDAGTSLDCDNDYYSGRDGVCNVSASVSSGDTVYILADTNSSGERGSAYELNIECI